MTDSSGANTFNVESIADNYLTRIYNGNGQDVVNLSPAAHNLDNLPGILDLEGFPGQTTSHVTLNLDDQNGPASQWFVQTGGSVRSAPGDGAVITQIYDGAMAAAVINGGNKGNTFKITGTTAGVPTTVNTGTGTNAVQITAAPSAPGGPLAVAGQGTSNTLDYSKYTGNVTVDLPLGTATGLTGVSDIQNVIGSTGNDIPGRRHQRPLLRGGTGRNLIIAGTAADLITGEPATTSSLRARPTTTRTSPRSTPSWPPGSRTDLDLHGSSEPDLQPPASPTR